MSESSEISPEDRELFRRSVGNVTRIKQNKAALTRRKPKPAPLQSRADERAVIAELAAGSEPEHIETGEEIQFKREGIQHRQFQKLRRGQFSIEAELDLHGMTIALAQEALPAFLTRAQAKSQSCVRIIHGKGRGSKDGRPVLKLKVQGWLQRHNGVLAYCSTRPIDGGTGAVYVLLRKSKTRA